MTLTCRLVDNENRVLVDLTGHNSIFCIDRAIPFDSEVSEPGKVAMSLRLVSKYGVAERMAEIEKIAESLDRARSAIGGFSQDMYVWLEMWENHEYPKRSLIYDGGLSFGGSSVSSLHQGKGSGTVVTMNVVRHEYWESTQPVQIDFTYETAGKPVLLPPLGTAPGRIVSTLFGSSGVSDANGLTGSAKMHAGIRRAYNGAEYYENSRLMPDTGWITLVNSNVWYGLLQFDTYNDFSGSQPHKLPHYHGLYRLFGLVVLRQNFTLGRTRAVLQTAPGETYGETNTGEETWLYGSTSATPTEHLVDYGLFSVPKNGSGVFYIQATHVEGSNKDAALLYVFLVPADYHAEDTSSNHIWGVHPGTGGNGYAIVTSPESVVQSYVTAHTSDVVPFPGVPGYFPEKAVWEYPPEGGAVMVTDLSKWRNTINATTGKLVGPDGGAIVQTGTRRGHMHVYPRWKMYRTRPV